MLKLLEYYQSLAQKFQSQFLTGPGIAIVLAGLCVWLAGLRWKRLLGALAGAIIAAAGIPYKVDGKFADFHSLRHSTASLLIQTGANPKVIQTLMRHTDLNLTMSKYTHIYAGQQRETIENLPDFIVHQDKAAKTGTNDCITENQSKIYCPKTAHENENLRTIPNNSSGAITLGNSGFEALNIKETAFSGNERRPAFSAEKWRRRESNPRPETFQNRHLHV